MGRLQYIGRYIVDGRPLGKGNFATVELATHSVTRSKVAIKIIDTKKIKEDYVRQNLHREARILAQVRHPNIIRLYETIRSSTLYCLVTEFAGGGQLLEFVREHKDGRLTEKTARPFVRQLVSALHHLQERGIVHRDLKMENIILDEKKKNLKIVDFGLSNTFRRDAMLQTHCGSPEYAAPELFVMGTKYGSEVDIWSLGINMYAMIVGKLPFTTPFSEPQRRQKLLQQIQYGLTAVHENDMKHLSPECCNLLHQCIEPNPNLRIPILDIEIHSWITDNGSQSFYYYQPPPKDREARKKITDRMSEMLKVPIDRIESNVHQYRCDDISAMYNLLMDEHLKCKGLMDIDHTVRKDYKRLLHGRDKGDKKSPEKSTEEEDSKKKAPTPVMLTKPSLYEPDYGIRRKSPGSSYSSSGKSLENATTANNMNSRTGHGTSPSPYMSLSSPPNHRTEHTDDDRVSANQEPEEDKSQPIRHIPEPIRHHEAETDQSEETEEVVPKLSIINMETFLSDGFKARLDRGNSSFPSGSQSSCGTPRTGSARSSHFEEVYKKYMLAEEAKAKEAVEKKAGKTELLEELLKSDKQSDGDDLQESEDVNAKDGGKAEAEDSGNDCRSEVNGVDASDEVLHVVGDETDENVRVDGHDDDHDKVEEKSVVNNDLKDVSSEYGSDSGKENRIVRWVKTTQETTFNCSLPASPDIIETPRKVFHTPVSVHSRDMFPSRQSQKSVQSKCSARSAPKPTPWKQQYNVTRTTTIPEPAVRESLKEKGQKQGRGFQGSTYSPRPDMRRMHAGRTPIRGEPVHQSVPEDGIRVGSSASTNTSRPETPSVSAWHDHIEKAYKLPTTDISTHNAVNSSSPHKSIPVISIRNKEVPSTKDVKMQKYTGKGISAPEKDIAKYKKENFPKDRVKNNIHVRIYSMIKEEETRQKRQLVLLHQQENQRKQQQQKLIQQQDWHRQQQHILQRRMNQWERRHGLTQPMGKKPVIVLPKRSLPSFSAVRREDIMSNRTKSAGVFQVVKRDKPVAVVTPRTVRIKPDLNSLAIVTKPPPTIKSARAQEPVFDLLGSQNVQAVKFPAPKKIKKVGWSQSSEKMHDWDAAYRLQRQVSSILKGAPQITQLHQVPKLDTIKSTLSAK